MGSVQFVSDTHQDSLQYTNMSRITQQHGDKIDCFWGFFLSLYAYDMMYFNPHQTQMFDLDSLLVKHEG